MVSTRLYAAFGLVGCVVAALLVLSYVQQARSEQVLRAVTETEYRHSREVAEWQLLATVTTTKIMALNRSSDPAVAQLFGPEIGASVQEINRRGDVIRAWAGSEEERTVMADIDRAAPLIVGALKKIAQAREAGDEAAAVAAFENQFLPEVQKYHASIDVFANLQQNRLNRYVQGLQADQWRQFWITAIAMMAAVGLAVGLVVALVRYLKRSLDHAVLVAQAVAAGDLTVRVPVQGRDEFGALMRSLSDMAQGLRDVVCQVRSGTEEIAGASQQIAQGNHDLSERTERQAGSLQQTASTMEQLAATVRQSAENAGEANALAGRASAVAQRGGEAVGLVVQTMSQIERSSRRIEEIIGVIDGISFQTNILALNAAVEAARAGEQGRGFAVVAGEVRSLAQRSATAAKEIKSLIADSGEKVRNGSSQVEVAGQTMAELVESVQQVSALIGEISSAAAEQRAGIDGVTHSVGQLDQSTQQNAALVEEAAAAASSLRDQAGVLAQAVAVFKVAQTV